MNIRRASFLKGERLSKIELQTEVAIKAAFVMTLNTDAVAFTGRRISCTKSTNQPQRDSVRFLAMNGLTGRYRVAAHRLVSGDDVPNSRSL
jgi:hypothetical protein